MLEFLNNNKQRILSPAIITLALYVIAALELPNKYNYLVPSVSEVLIALIFIFILSCQEHLGKWRRDRRRTANYNKLKTRLEEKLEIKGKLSGLGDEVLKSIDAQAISILEEIHKYESDEIKINRDEYEEITSENEKLRREKAKYKKEAIEGANKVIDKVQQHNRNVK